jgi:hypothetical protein
MHGFVAIASGLDRHGALLHTDMHTVGLPAALPLPMSGGESAPAWYDSMALSGMDSRVPVQQRIPLYQGVGHGRQASRPQGGMSCRVFYCRPNHVIVACSGLWGSLCSLLRSGCVEYDVRSKRRQMVRFLSHRNIRRHIQPSKEWLGRTFW